MDVAVVNQFLKLAQERNTELLKRELKHEWPGSADVLESSGLARSYCRLRNHLIVLKAAKLIAKTLKKRVVIATARIRSGLKGNLLYPIATFPMQLSSYFLDTEGYQHFVFDINALTTKGETYFVCDKKQWWGKELTLNAISDTDPGFSGRIKMFLLKVLETRAQYGLAGSDLEEMIKSGSCVFFGGINHEATFVPARNRSGEFHYLFALYLLPDPDFALGNGEEALVSPYKGFLPVVDEMFRALEISSRDDLKDFEGEGLKLVSELIPTLASRETAPSDAVAHFLDRMKGILESHTLGIEGKHTWMRFIAVNTVVGSNGRTYTPRFHIFPHCHTLGENAIAAFLLSHPKQRTTVKLMVYLWAEQKTGGVQLSPTFAALFRDVDRSRFVYDTKSKCVCISKDDDEDLWNKISISVDGAATQCTLGFIIERQFGRDTLPYAVLVFESDIPDAFSSQDVERFSNVVNACSEVFLALRISNTSFDLNWGIREAFGERSTRQPIGNGDPSPERNQQKYLFGRFLFELLRADKKVMEDLIGMDDHRIWDLSKLSKADATKYILEPLKDLKGVPDKEVCLRADYAPTLDKILRDRNTWIAENEARLYGVWRDSKVAGDIYEFLTHVPSNIVWHCYLNAIPRSIADRAMTNAENPEDDARGDNRPQFTVMQQHGGLSAMAMFVFRKGPWEFRQIIKLSSREKIKAEADNYRIYVRYNVPLSARLPHSGIAFEGDGDTSRPNEADGPPGQVEVPTTIRESRLGSGALVSDLIAGSAADGDPETFLCKTTNLVWKRPLSGSHAGPVDETPDHQRSVDDFLAAIEYQFEHNTSRWRKWPNAGNWVKGNVSETVKDIIRIGAAHSTSLDTLTQWEQGNDKPLGPLLKGCCGKLTNTNISDLFGRLLFSYDQGTQLTAAAAAPLGAVIHGDLNARNLVWSQDYLKFFMIDFEKVRVGFEGADQLRLVFSLLSDLVDEAYQREHFDARGVKAYLIGARKKEMNSIIKDIDHGIERTADILSAVCRWAALRGTEIDLPRSARNSTGICAKAVSKILSKQVFLKGNGNFWAFAIRMSAAKQFEYALRSIDESCSKPLERVLADTSAMNDIAKYNLYNYYTDEELMDPMNQGDDKPDKFVFGKIGRALFAYKTLARILSV